LRIVNPLKEGSTIGAACTVSSSYASNDAQSDYHQAYLFWYWYSNGSLCTSVSGSRRVLRPTCHVHQHVVAQELWLLELCLHDHHFFPFPFFFLFAPPPPITVLGVFVAVSFAPTSSATTPPCVLSLPSFLPFFLPFGR
jgi:hypothetical protein